MILSATRLGPQASQHPSAGGSLEVPRALSLAPPVMTCVGALISLAVSTPLLYSPRAPLMLHGTLQGSVSDVFRPQLNHRPAAWFQGGAEAAPPPAAATASATLGFLTPLVPTLVKLREVLWSRQCFVHDCVI